MIFDPSGVGQKGNLFGFTYSIAAADLVIIPVPWDVTVSYQEGTSVAPHLILDESSQLDFSLPTISDAFSYPVTMAPISKQIQELSRETRQVASELIDQLENGAKVDPRKINMVNDDCNQMVAWVAAEAKEFIQQGKICACLGGDHSAPLGLIQALGEKFGEFGILQIDAHMDLREAYEGFTYSHASIMFNALKKSTISKLVQIGIRDFCEEELQFVKNSEGRVVTFFDEKCNNEKWNGKPWVIQAAEMISHLPERVYVSFDMDGLDPSLCPNTGTPVPGGLNFYEAVYLIESLVASGRKIIGFDVSECGANVWDANVASRILYRLTAACGVSRGHLGFIEPK